MREACYFFLIFSVKSKSLSSLYYYIHILQSRSLLIFHLLACHFYQITWMQFVLIKLLNEPFVYSWSIYGIPCFSQRRLRWNCVCVCTCVCKRKKINMRERYKYCEAEKKGLLLWNWSHLSSFPFYPSSFIFLPLKCNTSTV